MGGGRGGQEVRGGDKIQIFGNTFYISFISSLYIHTYVCVHTYICMYVCMYLYVCMLGDFRKEENLLLQDP